MEHRKDNPQHAHQAHERRSSLRLSDLHRIVDHVVSDRMKGDPEHKASHEKHEHGKKK